ncbi:MAG: hypothetical protein LBF15_06795 [Candidatus Peribacteria bacterium]|jgi:hypothetical protein|nr:hypothetical protein [Candidatus Peribacteria bacterium]
MRNIEKDPRDVLTAFAREAGVPIRKGFYDFYNRSLLRASDEDLNRWYECKALKLFTGKGEFNKKAVEYAESHRGIIFTII